MLSLLAFKVFSVCPSSSLQFTPAIRPCLQTIAIGLVAFGENYRRHQSGIGQQRLLRSPPPLIVQPLHSHSPIVLIPHASPPLLLGPLTVYLLMLCVWIGDALSSSETSGARWAASSIFQSVFNMHALMYRGSGRSRTCSAVHTLTLTLIFNSDKRNPTTLMAFLCSVLHRSGGRWYCTLW